jgi:capsular exopolysaccharide synthesis family protein
MDLAEHFRRIRRRWWLILGVAVLVAGIVYAWSGRKADVYRSTATVDVLPNESDTGVLSSDQVQILLQRYSGLTGTASVLRDAIGRSGIDLTVGEATARVAADATSDNSGLLTIHADGPTPAAARALARATSEALRAAADEQGGDLRIVTAATPPGSPIAPKPTRDAMLAFLVALVVNAELVALLGSRAGRLVPGREAGTVEAITDTPVIGLLPRRTEWLAEAFRNLRSEFEVQRAGASARSVAVVGTDPGNGASFVAFGLAQATANLKLRVVLVDGNLRRPVLAGELDIPDQPGLSDFIRRGTVSWSELPQSNPLQTRFRVVPAGTEVADPAALLGGGSLTKIIHQLADSELVIVDAPALREGADALIIGAQCDAVILVVDAERTRRRTIEETTVRLQQANISLLGTVINRVAPDDRTRPPRHYRRPPTLDA